MITLLTALFYLWLVITILLIAMWFLRRQDRIKGEEEDDLLYRDPEPQSEPDGTEPVSPTPDGPEQDSTEQDSTEPDQPAPIESVEDSAPDAIADSEIAEETKAQPSAEAKATDEEPTTSLVGGLLAGLPLPYDLTAANERVTEPDRHVILLSTSSDAEAVGTAFADELVKLGYEIEPDGDDQAKAVRGGEVLSMRISPNAGTRGSGKYRRYPTAGDTDVAIEVWTGSDSPPRLAKS